MKSTRIEFVGGPIDGKVGKVKTDEMATYVGYMVGKREYLYQHAMRPSPTKGKPFRFSHRYVFMGHDAKLPPGVEEF